MTQNAGAEKHKLHYNSPIFSTHRNSLNRMITIIQDNVCSYVSPSSVPDFWFTTESILKTLPGNLVAFVITKDKPIFSPSQLHTSQPVKLCADEFLFPPNFAAITYEGNV